MIYIFGYLSREKSSLNNHVVFFISFLLSFFIGFVFGNLFIPLTGIRFLGSESSHVFTGVWDLGIKSIVFSSVKEIFVPTLYYYTFSAFMSLLVGTILYLLSFPQSGLSESLKEFLKKYSELSKR